MNYAFITGYLSLDVLKMCVTKTNLILSPIQRYSDDSSCIIDLMFTSYKNGVDDPFLDKMVGIIAPFIL